MTYGVGGESGSLEDVEEGTGVEGGLLVDGSDRGGLGGGGGEEGSLDVELQAWLREKAATLAIGAASQVSTQM